MQDWNNYRTELMQRLGQLGKLAPETMKGVVTLGSAGNKTDLLGAKVASLSHSPAQSLPAATAVLRFTRRPPSKPVPPMMKLPRLWAWPST